MRALLGVVQRWRYRRLLRRCFTSRALAQSRGELYRLAATLERNRPDIAAALRWYASSGELLGGMGGSEP